MANSLELHSKSGLISGGFGDGYDGLFRCRIDAMINLQHPLALLATRLPRVVIEASLAPNFERKDRSGQRIEGQDY